MKRTEDEYYKESKRLRAEVLMQANALKEHPLRFTITNGITMEVEITKTDLKTIVSKASRDNKFNAIKNALAVPTSHMQLLTTTLSLRQKNYCKKELRFNGLACRTNRGYPSEAEFKSASI